jgi:hypothetical protein
VSLTRTIAPGWCFDLGVATPLVTACLPLLNLATDESPFAGRRGGVEAGVSSSSRLRRERLVSFRPTEAGVPDRDSSPSSSSDSTVRDLRLGTESILTTYIGELTKVPGLLVGSPETRGWWALGRDTRLPSGGLLGTNTFFGHGRHDAYLHVSRSRNSIVLLLSTSDFLARDFRLSRKCQLRPYFIQ